MSSKTRTAGQERDRVGDEKERSEVRVGPRWGWRSVRGGVEPTTIGTVGERPSVGPSGVVGRATRTPLPVAVPTSHQPAPPPETDGEGTTPRDPVEWSRPLRRSTGTSTSGGSIPSSRRPVYPLFHSKNTPPTSRTGPGPRDVRGRSEPRQRFCRRDGVPLPPRPRRASRLLVPVSVVVLLSDRDPCPRKRFGREGL